MTVREGPIPFDEAGVLVGTITADDVISMLRED